MNSTSRMRSLPEPKTLDVLFVAYGGGHIKAIVPVAQMLRAQGYNISIFAMTTAIAISQASGMPHFSYSDLLQANDEDVQREGTRLAANFPSGGPIPAEETRAYMGINYMDLVQQHGLDEANVLYEVAGRQNFFPINHMTSCLEYLRPKLVITTNSPRSEYAALQAAGDLGIPSLCIVDMFALQEIAWLKTPGLGTKVCVLNEAVRDMFLREGRPEDEIEITGNPAFDGIYDPAVIQAGNDLRKARGWDSRRFTILYASSAEPSRHPFTGEAGDTKLSSRIEQHLRDILKDRPDLELVLRRHPSEDQEVKLGDRIYKSGQSEDVNVLIYAVDMVVITSSTVGLQAYLAGVPVVNIECSIMSKDSPYGDFGMSCSVPSLEVLETVLLGEIDRLRTVQTKKATVQQGHGYEVATRSVCDKAVRMLQQSALSISRE